MGEKTGKNDMVYNIVPLFNCRLVMHTYNTKSLPWYTHVKKQLWNIQKCFKNMYIDIFICIQIGPSQQKQTHIPFICLSFAKRGFLQRLMSAYTVQMSNWSVLALYILRSNLNGGNVLTSPTLAQTGRRKTKSTEPQLKCLSN